MFEDNTKFEYKIVRKATIMRQKSTENCRVLVTLLNVRHMAGFLTWRVQGMHCELDKQDSFCICLGKEKGKRQGKCL